MNIQRNVNFDVIEKNKMFIYNLGSGGTRYHVATQRLKTAGFIIKMNSFNMYVDPGTSALLTSLHRNVPLKDINSLFISHAHVDHYDDAEALIESIYLHSYKKNKPLLITNETVMGKIKGWERKISSYHEKLCSDIVTAKPGDKILLNDIKLEITRTIHHEPYNVGFVLRTGGVRIGYASDTVFYDDFEAYFKKVDVLILHPVVINKTHGNEFRHASYDDIIEMIISSQPKQVILRHIGYEILQYGIDKFKEEIHRETGVKVEYLLDGDCLVIG